MAANVFMDDLKQIQSIQQTVKQACSRGIPEQRTHEGRQVQADPGHAVLEGERHSPQHATHRDVCILIVLQLRVRLEGAGLRVGDSKWLEVFCKRLFFIFSSFLVS